MGDGYDDYERLATRPTDFARENALREARRREQDENPLLKVRLNQRLQVIEASGWFGEQTSQMYRSVGGGVFSQSPYPHWRYPLTMDVCRKLEEVFGDRVRLSQTLQEWMDRQES